MDLPSWNTYLNVSERRNPPTRTHELGTLQALTENVAVVSVGRWIWAPKKKAKHQKCAILFRFCSEIRILRFFLFFSGVYHWFLFRISCRKCWFRRMSTKTKTNLHGLWPTCCLNTLFFPTLLFHWLWPPKTVICWGLWVYNIYNNMFDTYNIL